MKFMGVLLFWTGVAAQYPFPALHELGITKLIAGCGVSFIGGLTYAKYLDRKEQSEA